MQNLKKINNQMKTYINEASGISDRCKRKLIKLVEKHFQVSLPHENYKNIDIEVLENGNIKMRDIEYKTANTPTENEFEERYNSFCNEVDELLELKATDFDRKKTSSNVSNILILLLYLVITLALLQYGIKLLLVKNVSGILYLAFILGYYILPLTGRKIKNRIDMAVRYLKRLFK